MLDKRQWHIQLAIANARRHGQLVLDAVPGSLYTLTERQSRNGSSGIIYPSSSDSRVCIMVELGCKGLSTENAHLSTSTP
jgi:hypothetical protein